MTLRLSTDEIVESDVGGALAIHPTWTRVRLREVADVQSGFPFKSADFSRERGMPLLRIRDVGAGAPETYIDGDVDSDYVVRSGDIVVGMDGDFRAARWRGADAALNQRVCRVLPKTNLYDDRLLFTALQPYLDAVNRATSAVTVKHLSSATISDLPLPLPPLAEQERIVAAIEEAFSKLDAGEAGLHAVRRLLKRMREAVLAAAVNGRLVRQDPADTPATELLATLGVEGVPPIGLPASWVAVRLGDVARVGSGSTPSRGNSAYWKDGTIPWITSGLITSGRIREAREFVSPLALSETALRFWPAGTLLVAMYGEGQTRGRCVELAIEATCNQACAAVVLHAELSGYRDFVRLSFDANYSANRRLASGGVQPNLNAGLIREMILILPPPEERLRIVAEVERQFSFIEACEHAVDVGLARSAALRRSVLKAAFEGRLVPQDPADEPASALLERIRSERSAAAPTGGRRGRQ